MKGSRPARGVPGRLVLLAGVTVVRRRQGGPTVSACPDATLVDHPSAARPATVDRGSSGAKRRRRLTVGFLQVLELLLLPFSIPFLPA